MEEKPMAQRTEVCNLGKWWSSCSLGPVCRNPQPSKGVKSWEKEDAMQWLRQV